MQIVVAGFDQVRPGQWRFVCSVARVRRANGGRLGGQLHRETLDSAMLARALGDATPAIGKYASYGRSAVVEKVRVLTS